MNLKNFAILILSFPLFSLPESESKPKGFFISIDGVNPEYIEKFSKNGLLKSPKGFQWLYENSLKAKKAIPVAITLTAPSHISNITCTEPASHGVPSNSFMENNQRLSGFTAPIKSETFWQSAKRQGKKVLSLGYVGADGSSEDRKADWGIAYPDSKLLGKNKEVKLKFSDMKIAQGWTLPNSLKACDNKESEINLNLNDKTGEKTSLFLLLSKCKGTNKFSLAKSKVALEKKRTKFNQATSNLITLKSSADENLMNLYFGEKDSNSTTKKRRIFFIPRFQNDELSLYVSNSTYNNVYPEEFKNLLDQKNIIWGDSIHDAGFTEMEMLKFKSIESENLLLAGIEGMKAYPYDVVLFYQPLIDSIGHSYEGKLPKAFSGKENDKYVRVLVESYKQVDANISKLLSQSSSINKDVITLIGDHGMDRSLKTFNPFPILKNLGALDKVELVTSGALALLYPKAGVADEIVDALGEKIAQEMAKVNFTNLPVLGKSHQKSKSSKWHYGQALWAFTSAEKFWFQYKTSEEIFGEPSAWGMHGHDPETPSMRTAMMIKAEGLSPGFFESTSLINALPTFVSLLGMEKPKDCQGKSIFDK